MTMSRSSATCLRLALAGVALPVLLAACTAGERVPAGESPEMEVDIAAGGAEPTRRDPLGYTGMPIDNNP